MARVNIEDSIFKDFRFMNLIMKTGSVDHAMGCLVRSWILAQEWFLNEETGGMIPVDEWKKQGISNLLIEVGLAEIGAANLIRVAGSSEQFAWLNQKAAAGKKSGETRRSKSEREPTETNVCSTGGSVCSTEGNGGEPPTLSPTLPPTLSHSTFSNTPQGEAEDERDALKSAQEKSTDELVQIGKKSKVKVDQVIELYNGILAGIGKLKHCRDLGDKSKRELINSFEVFPTLDHWKVIFEIVRKNKRLSGQVETTWLATLPWLVVKENALKVEMGTYDDDFGDSKKKQIEKNLKDLELE